MSTAPRVLAVTAAACLGIPLWAAPAVAATVTETASVGAYYLATNPGNVETPLGPQRGPDNAKAADGVAQDDLAVSVAAPGMDPDKFSALLWDLVDLTPGATVEKATVVLPFSTKPESSSTAKDPALLQVCLAGPEGFGDADGEPVGDAPTFDAAVCAGGAPAEGGTALEFDITAIAQKWTEMNSGLVLVPTGAGKARPFQTVFADKSRARIAVAFTGGTATEAPPVDDAELLVTPDSGGGTTPLDLGGGFDAGSGAVDTSGGVPFDAGSVDAPSLAGAPLDSGQAPAVADPVTAAPALVPAASSLNPMAFDALTWAALLGGAALLAAVSLALGAPVPVPGAAAPTVRPGGVASALSRGATRLR